MNDNTNASRLQKLRGAAMAALALVVAALILRGVIEHDRTEIKENTSMPSSSVVIEPDDTEKIDLNAVTASFVYAEITPDDADSLLLSMGGAAAPKSRLQPVYNGVFSDDGIQVASLADTKLMCAAEAVYPLGRMLTGFYAETGMRTVMVSSAYKAPPEPQYNEYGYESEAAPPDESASGLLIGFRLYEEYSGSRKFTGQGVYSWFTDNCWKYGFIVRYPKDCEEITGHDADLTHFRYVGEAAARIMHDNELCLEELEGFLPGLSFDDPIIKPINNRPTLIYAIAADESGHAQIRLPADPDGNAAPYKAYKCGGQYLICAELQYTPLLESAETDMASDETSDMEE